MKSNFRMAESKIGMRAMYGNNKIALPVCAGDAILRFGTNDCVLRNTEF
jgi:hypothetical protein